MTVALSDTRRKDWSRNAYVESLYEAMQPMKVAGFSWLRAIFGAYDVLHLQWPEHLMRHRSATIRALRHALCWVLLVRLRACQTPVIRTMHNLEPHAASSQAEARLLRLLDSLVVSRIWLTDPSDYGFTPDRDDEIIPHGDYSKMCERLDNSASPALAEDIDLLAFGILRPYKGIDRVARAIRDTEHIQLLICGKAPDPAYLAELRQIAFQAPNIRLEPGRVDDETLVKTIRASRSAIAAYPDLYNSGVVFLALTLERPVLVLSNPSAYRLRDEFGPGWVRVLDAVSAEAIYDALLIPTPPTPPDFGHRTWESIGESHRALFDRMAAGITPNS